MRTHILVAGVPARFHAQLQKALGTIERADQSFRPIIVPMSDQHPLNYSIGYTRRILARLAQGVSACEEQQSCLVTYLDYPSAHLLREAVYRFALLAAVPPPEGEELRFDRQRQTVNRLMADCRRAYSHFRGVIKAVGTEVESGRNRTPLLLPTQNFDSQHLNHLLRALACNLVATQSQDAAQVEITRLVTVFSRYHPMVQLERGQKSHSNGKLLFKSPGKYLHAMQHTPDKHLDECIIGARIRLGHCFHQQFHYDVEPNKGRFSTVLASCHGSFDVPHGSAYVNVAPNDHVRGKAE